VVSLADKTKNIVVFGAIFFLVPFIEVADPKQCFTTPCEQTKFVSISNMIADLMHPTDEPVACIQIFDPVCDIDGMTWSNQCVAESVGATVAFKGVCP
jgi:hypothetical protein